ncbi:hypothetical protein HU200_032759 [Digitaria exilis]|uniref:Uncharacterized protein n=1 Tax=Digitaria exilis TaxID=1010633 RepID=A0A835BLY8_9POAL|nr:hypothetical protein HU200_032759 [Digitaria exilis]
MHDQKELREKLGRLIWAYRTGRSNASAAGARAPETARTTAAAMETGTAASIEWSGEQALLEKEIASLLDRAGGGHQFTGAALPQRAVPLLGDKQLHDDQPKVFQEWLRAMTWAEEAEPTPALTRQGLHIDEQSLANGMFQGVTWPQPAAHLLPGQQLQYQQEQAGQQEQPCFLDQATQLRAGQQQLLHYQEQDLPDGQQPHYQQQAVHLPAEQQELMYLQQEQLMANGGFQIQGTPLALAAGLPISNSVMDSWPLPLDGIGWGREQPDEPLLQRWPGSGADPLPSSIIPGAELHGN